MKGETVTRNIDLRKLANETGPDRCFLSLFLNAKSSWQQLERRFEEYRGLLDRSSDERENFDRTTEMIRERLQRKPPQSGSLAVFACWLSDFYESHCLSVELKERVILDSSPYVRPLAEFLDEYETFCIVLLDHKGARIFLVTGASIVQVDRARGDIKNHVRKGGWSQQRYERRRDKQIHEYCQEIAARLDELAKDEPFEELIIAGDRVLIKELQGYLSSAMAQKLAAAEPLRAGLSDRELLEQLYPSYMREERREEKELFEAIREECFREGRAATGPLPVLAKLKEGRVNHLLVDRDLALKGFRCRGCELLGHGIPDNCPRCEGEIFEVDLVNELVELAAQTGAETEFADAIDGLTRWGGVAALLRY
jgi:peptide chain release factor subunit 1